MIDLLLVLGQIPGTDIRITFNQIIISLALGLVLYFRRKLYRLAIHNAKRLTAYIKQKLQRRRQLRLSI